MNPENVDSMYSNQYPSSEDSPPPSSSSSSSSSSSQLQSQHSGEIQVQDKDDQSKGSSSKLSVMDEIRKMREVLS